MTTGKFCKSYLSSTLLEADETKGIGHRTEIIVEIRMGAAVLLDKTVAVEFRGYCHMVGRYVVDVQDVLDVD